MSNERRHPDEVSDPIVSAAYRELSDERAPAHLDHEVLNMARNAAKERHRSAMTWLRPAAWVATVGLCLAIVLEVANLPTEEQANIPTEKERVSEAGEPSSVDEHVSVEEEMAVPQRSQLRKSESLHDQESQRHENIPAAAIETEALRGAERQFLREAEDRARVQVGSDTEAERALNLAAPAAAELARDAAIERYCEEEQTSDPNRWLDCILELENRGMPAAAMLERELLKETFPQQPTSIYRD